jgi:hypothetical protein
VQKRQVAPNDNLKLFKSSAYGVPWISAKRRTLQWFQTLPFEARALGTDLRSQLFSCARDGFMVFIPSSHLELCDKLYLLNQTSWRLKLVCRFKFSFIADCFGQ